MKKLIYAMLAAPILAFMMVGVHVYFLMSTPYEGENGVFQIQPGEGFARINSRLKNEGFIDNVRLFHYYARLTNSMTKFKAGSYNINKGMDMFDVMETLVEGNPVLFNITIPEGRNIYEIAKLFKEKGILESEEKFVKLAKSAELISELDIGDAPSIEGYLYPETYSFAPNTPAKMILKTMMKQFKIATSKLDLAGSRLTPHEVVILASIVEKETGAPFERPTIAGVYHNRLKKKMRLQADPTTIYGIYHRDGKFNGNLRKKDLLEKGPYNTYKIYGLPLGPICNPGFEALKATLAPESHNFLYFVSKNDGTHVFTPTYKEHNKAVTKWQRTRKNRKGKSWRDLKKKK